MKLGLIDDMNDYKVMPTVPEENIFWDISTERIVDSSSLSYKYLSEYIDIEEWKKSFFELYNKWLKEDDDSVYDIHNEVSRSMINALMEINKKADFKLYYWFDVDRNKYPNYVWRKCPIAGTDLIDLPEYYSMNNRKISVDYPLVFPLV